jgi:hypothetical protein
VGHVAASRRVRHTQEFEVAREGVEQSAKEATQDVGVALAKTASDTIQHTSDLGRRFVGQSLSKRASNKTSITNPRRLLSAPRDSNPWLAGAKLESTVVGEEGLIVYRAHGSGRATGGWVTLEPPPNQAFVRQELAVHPDWNDATHYSKIRLAPRTRIQSGIAGPQDFPGGIGGGHQIQILNFEEILKQEVLKTLELPH